MKPYGSYHGGAIDQIGLSNQNLSLQAQVFAYSQRGGELAYPIMVQYNNKNFSIYVPTCPTGVNHSLEIYLNLARRMTLTANRPALGG